MIHSHRDVLFLPQMQRMLQMGCWCCWRRASTADRACMTTDVCLFRPFQSDRNARVSAVHSVDWRRKQNEGKGSGTKRRRQDLYRPMSLCSSVRLTVSDCLCVAVQRDVVIPTVRMKCSIEYQPHLSALSAIGDEDDDVADAIYGREMNDDTSRCASEQNSFTCAHALCAWGSLYIALNTYNSILLSCILWIWCSEHRASLYLALLNVQCMHQAALIDEYLYVERYWICVRKNICMWIVLCVQCMHICVYVYI